MVAQDPLFSGRWSIKKYQALILNDILAEMIVFSGIATMVVCVSEFTKHDLGINSALLTVLGTVLGLVISFRTSTAYERFTEGRKIWTAIGVTSRNMAQQIWVHIPNKRLDKSGAEIQTEFQSVVEKKSMINLIQGFSVATKHAIRGEVGVYYEDLYPLVSFLPRFHSSMKGGDHDDLLPLWRASEEEDPFAGSAVRPALSSASTAVSVKSMSTIDLEKAGTKREHHLRAKDEQYRRTLGNPSCHRPLQPSRNPPVEGFLDYFPLFRPFRFIARAFVFRSKTERELHARKRKSTPTDSNVPLEICLYLSSYLANMLQGGLLQPAIATGLIGNLTSLQDSAGNLDRIRSTPLPFAYQAHLRMSLWLYLALLPFQIYPTLKWLTIPGTAFAAFLLCGFLEIGQEIENPFNYDLNDLDLDSFCTSMQRELAQITAHTMPPLSSYVFSEYNQPFAPCDRRTAEVLNGRMEEYEHDGVVGEAAVRRTMIKNWRDVDTITRHVA
jgi:predicted membrane chloride channel (bestrophin family)